MHASYVFVYAVYSPHLKIILMCQWRQKLMLLKAVMVFLSLSMQRSVMQVFLSKAEGLLVLLIYARCQLVLTVESILACTNVQSCRRAVMECCAAFSKYCSRKSSHWLPIPSFILLSMSSPSSTGACAQCAVIVELMAVMHYGQFQQCGHGQC